jgi:hypothetical protein
MSAYQLKTSVPADGVLSFVLPERYRGTTVRLEVVPEPAAEYSMKDAFAAWDSEQSPAAAARELRQSRRFNQIRESL